MNNFFFLKKAKKATEFVKKTEKVTIVHGRLAAL